MSAQVRAGAGVVLAASAFLTKLGVWTPEMKVASRRWLANFQGDEEVAFASAALDSFVFFSDRLVDRLFVAAFDVLAAEITSGAADYAAKKAEWRDFLDRVLVTHPTGEMPNATDSGYAFDRMARQTIGVPQPHIMEPEGIIRKLVSGSSAAVVFVDDFVGSGDQFVNTWQRTYTISGDNVSFESLAANGHGPFYYCPLICTMQGNQVIAGACPDLRIRPTHLLPDEYSARHSSSLFWPEQLRAGAIPFVEKASARAGIPSTRIWGYAELGLGIAFEHGTPDATLPLFHWEENGWIPLVRLR